MGTNVVWSQAHSFVFQGPTYWLVEVSDTWKLMVSPATCILLHTTYLLSLNSAKQQTTDCPNTKSSWKVIRQSLILYFQAAAAALGW